LDAATRKTAGSMNDILTKINSLDLSTIPEPFKVTEHATITNLKRFVESKTNLYNNTKGEMQKLQEDELNQFYEAVVEFQKVPVKKKTKTKK
jgi:hypothetical protein